MKPYTRTWVSTSNNPVIILLQYVDNILIAAEIKEGCKKGTQNLLQALGNMGYRVSAKKAQLCKTEVTYPGYVLKEGQWWLPTARKEDCSQYPRPPEPKTGKRVLGVIRLLQTMDSRLH